MKRKNYGIDLSKEKSEISYKDWTFGASSLKCLAEIPPYGRSKFLPAGELQFGKEDFMDCASRSVLNILKTKFNFLAANNKISEENKNWLVDNGYISENGIEFSDAFVAINSGTTREGNSLKAPLEAVRKKGLIPKSMLPAGPEMTFDDYHDPKRITPAMIKLGKEFIRRFTINYERVYEEDYSDLIEKDLLNVAGYAWPRPKNGEYPRVNYDPNHAFVVYQPRYFAFDSYIDSEDGDYIKKLAFNYNFFDYGYRVLISKENTISGFWEKLKSIFRNFWREIML